MKNDDNHPANPQDLEMEARIVALVLGETSDFERAELERLLGSRPELAIFKRRIEAVHGLVAEADKPAQQALTLSSDRRAKLLETIGAAADRKPLTPSAASSLGSPPRFVVLSRKISRQAIWMSGIAAGLVVALFINVGDWTLDSTFSGSAESADQAVTVTAETPPLTGLDHARATATGDTEKRDNTPAGDRSGVDQTMSRRAAGPASAPAESGEGRASDPLNKAKLAGAGGGERDSGSVTLGREPAKSVFDKPVPAPLGSGSSEPVTPVGAVPRLDETGTPMETVKLDEHVVQSQYESHARGLASSSSNDSFLPKGPATFADGFLTASGDAPSIGGLSKERSADDRITFGIPAGAKDAKASKNEAEKAAGTDSKSVEEQTVTLSAFAVSAAPQPAPVPAPKSEGVRSRQMSAKAAAVTGAAAAADLPLVRPKQPQERLVEELAAATSSVSTFSLHVSDVSFRLAQSALARGQLPDPERIRPEEFYNAFDYGDSAPSMAEKISCRLEQAAHPFLQQRNLVRIAMKVPAVGRGAAQPLRLTVLLDTSGSMEREDRATSVRRGLEVLAGLLGPNDRLTVIGFARTPRLLIDGVAGDQALRAIEAIAKTPAEGGTNLEEALKLGTELARRHKAADAQNRMVLLTDGAANLGNANPASLAASIEALREQGIAFDACGVGLDGLDDEMLESLTRKGDGRYYVLNSPADADSGFARQLAGALRPAAQNVKVQVRFNPARVGSYRLIGFEQHRLKEADFRNDKVDAAELAAEEAAIAVYQIEPLPQGEGELGDVFVRFRDANTGQMVERSWTLTYDAQVKSFARASFTMQLASTAALLAEKLRGGAPAEAIKLDELAPIVTGLRGHYANSPRVKELATMFEQMRRLNLR